MASLTGNRHAKLSGEMHQRTIERIDLGASPRSPGAATWKAIVSAPSSGLGCVLAGRPPAADTGGLDNGEDFIKELVHQVGRSIRARDLTWSEACYGALWG